MTGGTEYARRLVKGSTAVFLALIGSQLAALLLRMVLARSFTEEEYGLFYSVLFFISFFGLFRGLGLGTALAKFIPEFAVKKEYWKIKSSLYIVLGIQAVASAVIVVILAVFSNFLATSFFRNTAALPLIYLLSGWFFVMIFLNFLTVFQGLQRMTVYAVLQFLRNVLVVVLAIVLIWVFGLGLPGVALAYLVELSIVVGIAYILLRVLCPHIFESKKKKDKGLAGDLIKFGIPVFLGGLAGLILGYMDTLMIQGFLSTADVGYYQIAYPASHFLWYLPSALITVLLPMVSEMWATRKKKLLRRGIEILLKFSFLAILPGTILLTAFPEIVINVLFGPRYLPATATLQALSLAALPYTVFLILSTVMQGVGKPIFATKAILITSVVNFFGNLFLIPLYGILGAAVATLISYLIGAVILGCWIGKTIEVKIPWSSIMKGLIGGTLTFFMVLVLKSALNLHPWIELFMVMIPGIVLYAVWIILTKALSRSDLALLVRIIPVPKILLRIAKIWRNS